MILIDTSVWIEFFRAREPYYSQTIEMLEEGQIQGVACVFGELLQGAQSKRERTLILDIWNNLPKGGDADTIVWAGLESGKHKWMDKGIGLIDAAIIMAARSARAQIWTLDKKLKGVLDPQESF